MGGNVWIVGFKFDVLLRLGEVKQHDSVIDCEAWKTEQMHEGHAALAKRARESGDAILAISHGGIIDLPAVALGEQLRMRLAGPSFRFLDGVRVRYEKGVPETIEVLRAR